MSFLFHHKTKKAMQYLWIALSIIIILSMVITYTGLSRVSTQTPQDAQAQGNQLPPTPSSTPVTASSTPEPVQKLPFRVTPN